MNSLILCLDKFNVNESTSKCNIYNPQETENLPPRCGVELYS